MTSLHEAFHSAHAALETAKENTRSMTLALETMRTDLYDKQQELLARQDEDAQFLSKAIIGKADRALCVRCGESLGKNSWPMCIRCTSRSKERVTSVELAQAAISGTVRNLETAKAEAEAARKVEVAAAEAFLKAEYDQAADAIIDLLRKAYLLACRSDALSQVGVNRKFSDYGLLGRGGWVGERGESQLIQHAISNLRGTPAAPAERNTERKSFDAIRFEAREQVAAETFAPIPQAGGRPAPVYEKVQLPKMKPASHIRGGKTLVALGEYDSE